MSKPVIKVSEVLSLLDEGKSREEIGEHYGITKADVSRLFQNPLLKGKKAKKQGQFELVDDVSVNLTTTVQEEEVSNAPFVSQVLEGQVVEEEDQTPGEEEEVSTNTEDQTNPSNWE